jgi:hypothetical protein
MSRTVAGGRPWSSLSALALLLFVSVSAALWAVGNGAPYAHDATETYLTYLAGYNAATFPGVNPLIADIAASLEPAAHPSYDTRNPNLFAHTVSQLLIRADIVDLRAHDALAIGVTVFGLIVAMRVLTSMGGTALAATTIVLFALHYVGVLNWTDNLVRAVHFPLFWGNVHLLQRYIERPTRLRLALAAMGLTAVFVNDLTLGAFVLLTELFVFWQLPQPVRAKITFTVVAALGAGAALASWVAVLIFTLGPTVFTTTLSIQRMIPWVQAVDARDRFQLIASAYRDMFGLGHGALTLLIYPLLLFEIARVIWSGLARIAQVGRIGRPWPIDVSVLTVVGLSIVAGLWIDGSTSLLGDWEPVAGWHILHVGLWVGLGGLLVTIVARLSTRRWQGYVDDPRPRLDVLTTRMYIAAVGLAAAVLTLGSIGDFTDNFIRTYQPSMVFVEDVILATALIALARKVPTARGWSLESVAALGLLVMLGSYWLVYQSKLAIGNPPTEIGVASALRGNARLAGASIIAPDIYPVVWYYTRGRAHSVELSALGSAALRAQFLVCVNQCDRWTSALRDVGLVVNPGWNLVKTPRYSIYALPVCNTSELQPVSPGGPCAPEAVAEAPPSLGLIRDSPSSRVALTVTQTDNGYVAHVRYMYSQAAGVPEVGSVVRLYVVRPSGETCLIAEGAGQADFHIPGVSSGRFLAAAIPRSAVGVGQEYISDPLDVRALQIFELPDTHSGGVQQITATSLEEAEQIAIAAGTWSPSAGTLGKDAVTAITHYPTAENLCRR